MLPIHAGLDPEGEKERGQKPYKESSELRKARGVPRRIERGRGRGEGGLREGRESYWREKRRIDPLLQRKKHNDTKNAEE